MKKLYSPFFLRTAFAILLMLAFVRGWGQYSITGTGSGNTYIQNFDAFRGTSATVPINWVASSTQNGTAGNRILTAGVGTPTVATANGNNFYAGRTSSTSTDYSILQKQGTSGSSYFTFNAVNNMGTTINGFVVTWNVEQLAASGRATTVNLEYSINGGGWTTANITGTNLYTSSTGSSTNFNFVNGTPTPFSIAIVNIAVNNGETISFRYDIKTGSGSGNNAHVGIDDFTVYATTASTNDTTSEVDGPVLASQPNPVLISSLADTDAEAVKVFDFDIYDYGTADGLPTHVTQVTIKPGANNTANWANSIQNAKLSLNGGTTFVTTGTPVITAGSIVFPITSGNLDVADSDGETVSLFVYLKNSGLVDNSILEFSVPASAHGFTANSTGSTFATTFANATVSNEMLIDVEASKLIVGTQPSATACPNTNLTTAPVFRATDANNNIDTDFTNQVTLSNSGSLGMANASLNAISGVATFTNLQFTATGTVTLNASATGITASPASNSVVISVANATGFSATNGNAQSVVGWTNPSCFDEVMIVAKAGSAVTAAPSGDGSAYTGNLSFSAGTSFDGGFVIYNGSASPQTLTNLINGTTYHLTIFTRKGTAWSVGATTTCTPNLASSSTDHFRSNVVAGTWAIPANWQSSPTGGVADSEWITATLAPTSSANSITIRTGHTITSSASATSRNMTIDATGVLVVNANTFALNGVNNINGTLTRISTGAFTNNSTSITFGANSIYNHNLNGGTIPTATWHLNSTCNLTGMIATAPTLSSFNQTFGNLIWDNTGQTTFVNFDATVTTFSVLGTFSVLSTGTRAFNFNSASATAKNYTINNFLIAGTSQVQMSFLTGSNVPVTTLNVLGDLTLQDSAILDFGANTGNGPIYFGSNRYRSMIKLAGNLSASSASSLIIGNNTSYGIIEFDNTSVKNLVIQNPNTSSVLFEVLPASKVALQSDIVLDSFNGFDVEGTLDLGTHTITGIDGDFNYFYNYPNSTLRIAHPEGIASLLTYPITGAVRVDANSEGYDIGANYVYYGVSNQITGNGLPEFIKNITIENTGITGSNEVTLTNTALGVSDNLFVSNGIFNTSDKEVYGGGVSSSELRVNSGAELKIGGARTFPLEFGTITFQPLSYVHYAGADQSVVNKNVSGYSNLPNYENLRTSGTGIKTLSAGETVVNEKTFVDAAELNIPRSADDAASFVLHSKKGIEVAATGTAKALFESGAQLLQEKDASNSGKITMLREASVPSTQYNYWASPVKDQPLYGLYGALDMPDKTVKTYNTATDFFTNLLKSSNPTSLFGKGYSIKGPTNSTIAPYPITATFVGEPNNESTTPSENTTPLSTVGARYNLIGNPYPSNLNLVELYNANVGQFHIDGADTPTAYLWDNTGNTHLIQQGSEYANYATNNYATVNLSSGIGTSATSPTASVKKPNGIVRPGQGFIIKASAGATGLTFKNEDMRTSSIEMGGSNSEYFKNTSTPSNDNFWLTLTTPSNMNIVIAMSYNPNAENTFERFDSKVPNEAVTENFYSLSSDAKKLAIQSRKDFTTSDVVPLGIKSSKTEIQKISIDEKYGVFENQNIYLKDNLLNIVTNLSQGAYEFTAPIGINENRFEIVFEPSATLGTGATTKESLQVYRNGESFVVKSGQSKIDEVEVFDASGRLFQKVKGGSTEAKLDATVLPAGMYILKISRSNETISKKIIK